MTVARNRGTRRKGIQNKLRVWVKYFKREALRVKMRAWKHNINKKCYILIIVLKSLKSELMWKKT
jgi:hypothetical protein